MTTRKMTTIRQLEDQLQLTLAELKISKARCQELLSEREDSEIEISNILEQNMKLKGEMVAMSSQLTEAQDQRDQLQGRVDVFDQDSEEYEVALKRIVVLECELRDAHNKISRLELSHSNENASRTQSLFDELVGDTLGVVPATTPSHDLTCPGFTIDLTCDSPVVSLIHHDNFQDERLSLINELNKCNLTLENTRESYEIEIRRLQSEMSSLSQFLDTLTSQYEAAQRDIRGYERTVDELLTISKSNMERFDSFTNNHRCCCERPSTPFSRSAHVLECSLSPQSASHVDSEPAAALASLDSLSSSNLNNIHFSPAAPAQKIVMYSDEMGKTMGLQLSQLLGQAIINNCMPGASIIDILKHVNTSNHLENTTIIVLAGRRGYASKKQLISYFSLLDNLPNVSQIILFALPFGSNLSSCENKLRHDLNGTLHTLVCRHFTKFHFIDTNYYISKFYVTKDRYHLSKFYRRQIAESLSYFLKNSANSLASSTYCTIAPIEQSISSDIVCDIQNNLN